MSVMENWPGHLEHSIADLRNKQQVSNSSLTEIRSVRVEKAIIDRVFVVRMVKVSTDLSYFLMTILFSNTAR
jgi:hypothetical protein